ncbi:MAG: hypothetical protein IT168_05645 [Bryobacterales bacterium]|nr:hypothetical protein [Bryobacterales bacterium]
MTRWPLRTVALALALFLLNVALNAPLFLPGESKYRDSIEGGYASMAVFISEHPDPFGWNPLQYGGMPTQFWYLPGIPYLSALAINLVPHLKPEHIYRLVTVTLACLPPVTLFLMVLYFTRNRAWAFIAGFAYTFLSPAYLLYPDIFRDRGITYVPWRIQVLIKYGEGPHNAGLAMLPLAIVACWRAAITRRFSTLFMAAVMLAAITLTNWVAALGLAWCVVTLLVTGVGTGPSTGFLGRRVLLAAGLAYLLACFWLTPTFIRTTLFNWPVDAFQYKMQWGQWLMLGALAALTALGRLVFWRYPKQYFVCFLMLTFLGYFLVVSGHYWLRVETIPESRRYALEAEMFFFALFAEFGRQLSLQRPRWPRDVAVALLVLMLEHGLPQARSYVEKTWILLRPSPRERHPEFQVASYLAQRKPARVFVSGGTRFRLNSWFDVPQLGGTFESGLQNRVPLAFLEHVVWGKGSTAETRVRDVTWLLRAWGVEYFAVHTKDSAEHWRDIQQAGLLREQMEPVYENGPEQVYKLPFRSLAHLVLPEELPAVRPTGLLQVDLLEPLVKGFDDPRRPTAECKFVSNSSVSIRSAVPEKYWMDIAISYHPGWHAWQDGAELPVETNTLGHIVLKPKAAKMTEIRLEYRPPLEQVAFTAISLTAWAAALTALYRGRRRRA